MSSDSKQVALPKHYQDLDRITQEREACIAYHGSEKAVDIERRAIADLLRRKKEDARVLRNALKSFIDRYGTEELGELHPVVDEIWASRIRMAKTLLERKFKR